MKILLSISHEGVRTVRGASRARWTPLYEVPAFTVVRFHDNAGGREKRLEFPGDLAIQTALDKAREVYPYLQTSDFIAEYNARASSAALRLV